MVVDFSPPDISEEEISAVAEVLRSGWITTGPVTKRFEHEIEDYLGCERCACLASATAALEHSLHVLGIGPGDEVITCAYTFTASASVIAHVGAKIVLVDSEKDSPLIDLDKLEDAITDRTKAVIPIDYAGIPIDYERILEIVESKKSLFKPSSRLQRELGRIAVVADCAHSFGSKFKGRCVPYYADFACYSFHAVKSLTTAEGGAVCFRQIGSVTAEEIYKEFMLLSLHGETKDALAKTKAGSWEYDVALPGYKDNMTDIMSAIGSVQLRRFPGIIGRRFEIASMYDEGLRSNEKLILPNYTEGEKWSIPYVYFIRVKGAKHEDRNSLITALAEKGIRANVHFKPLPMMSGYARMGFDIADYPNAYAFFENEISLPFNTVITDEQVRYVIDTLNALC